MSTLYEILPILTNLCKVYSYISVKQRCSNKIELFSDRPNSHLQLKKEFGVNYAFPRSDDKDQDTITIMGRQEQVEKAAANLRESIKELENTAEDEIQIDGEYFKKVTSRSVSYFLLLTGLLRASQSKN